MILILIALAILLLFVLGYIFIGRPVLETLGRKPPTTIGPDALWAAYHRRKRNGSWVPPRPDPLRVSRPGARFETTSAGEGPARDVLGSGEDGRGGST